ncbi:NERD domain-containing protein [Proteobacteria bacterium 005FR1]|nr:NERD domain-containing protein [Proteobacteria bacterium 005FR1]
MAGLSISMITLGGVSTLLLGLLVALLLRIRANRRTSRGESLDIRLGNQDFPARVTSELEKLKEKGFLVFHGLQMGKFTVDHVVLSATGVFVLDSRSLAYRAMTTSERRPSEAVTYKNGVLHFPDAVNRAAAETAWAYATAISDRLGRLSGIPVRAKPLVLLSGWQIDNQGKTAVPVIPIERIVFYIANSRLQSFSASELIRLRGILESPPESAPPLQPAKAQRTSQ